MKKLENLIKDGIAFNLYRNESLLEDRNYYNEEMLNKLTKKKGKEFLDHLYAFAYVNYESNKIVNKKVFSFLSAQIGIGYKGVLFEKGKHHPKILIYNSSINKVIGIGVGRNNNVFVLKYDPPKSSKNESDIAYFTKLDFANVIKNIISDLQETMSYHYDRCALSEDDLETNVEFELNENMDDAFYNVKIAIPTLPDDMGDISPGDF